MQKLVETKICSKCGIEKGFSEFHKDKSVKNNLCSWCKACKLESSKKYYFENKNKRLDAQKKYREKNRDLIIEKQKKYQQRPEIKKRMNLYEKDYRNKSTNKERAYEYRKKNKDKMKEYCKKYRQNPKNREREINQKLLDKYNITLEEKNAMIDNQDGKCLICGDILDKGSRTCVDHCHKTKNIRGILCSRCNSLLGFSEDNVEILKNAIKYLEN